MFSTTIATFGIVIGMGSISIPPWSESDRQTTLVPEVLVPPYYKLKINTSENRAEDLWELSTRVLADNTRTSGIRASGYCQNLGLFMHNLGKNWQLINILFCGYRSTRLVDLLQVSLSLSYSIDPLQGV